LYRERKEPLPEQILFPYPHPKTLGLILDRERASGGGARRRGLAGGESGFQKGDAILTLEGQTAAVDCGCAMGVASDSARGGGAQGGGAAFGRQK